MCSSERQGGRKAAWYVCRPVDLQHFRFDVVCVRRHRLFFLRVSEKVAEWCRGNFTSGWWVENRPFASPTVRQLVKVKEDCHVTKIDQ